MTHENTPYAAPDFSLVSHDDKRVRLEDFRGSWLALYFYPKDDTPGCTAEACSVRDARDELARLGVVVVGVSMDTPEEHRQFREKYRLDFMLLSDPRAEVLQRYGAWKQHGFGREGVLRRTYLIDPEGMVQKVYEQVTPKEHGAEIAHDVAELQAK